MFGNVPRALWSQLCPPDTEGRIALSTRAFLVEDGEQRILLETGVGAFFPPKLRERFGVREADHRLVASLRERGLEPGDIDVVILSHLHFDHAGGLLTTYEPGKEPSLLFERAKFLVSRDAFSRADHPHLRDRASFVPELNKLLVESGRLRLVEGERSPELSCRFRFRYTEGHSVGMMLTELHGTHEKAIFAADLIPGRPWVHLPFTMGYDRFPERLIDEKRALYDDWEGGWLLFTHDDEMGAGKLTKDERGRFSVREERSVLDAYDLDAQRAVL